jgi:hypothetical protein
MREAEGIEVRKRGKSVIISMLTRTKVYCITLSTLDLAIDVLALSVS